MTLIVTVLHDLNGGVLVQSDMKTWVEQADIWGMEKDKSLEIWMKFEGK